MTGQARDNEGGSTPAAGNGYPPSVSPASSHFR